MKKTSAKKRIIAERMEPRLLFSADPLGLAVGAAILSNADDHSNSLSLEQLVSPDVADPVYSPSEIEPVTLIFIDIRNEDSRAHLESLLTEDQSNAIVYSIDPSSGGIDSVSNLIANHQSIESIHFLVHGDNQGLRLGSDWLDIDSIEDFQKQLQNWSNFLSDNADILLYGCDLSSGDKGLSLIQQLATLTGADIAASEDTTGHRDRGGNWILEHSTGSIESSSIVTERIQNDWIGALELIAVTTTSDTVDGDTSSITALRADKGTDGEISIREAITAANNTPGADEITLIAGSYQFDADPSEDFNAGGDFDIRDDLTIVGVSAGATEFDGRDLDRIFDIHDAVSFELSNVTLLNGEVAENGGAIRISSGTSTLDNVVIRDSQSTDGQGGGVYMVDGHLIINDSVLHDNIAARDGGAITTEGLGGLTLSNSEVYQNESDRDGGGIANKNNINATASSSIVNSYIHDNDAAFAGGGLSASDSPELTITGSTFAHNDSFIGGGARLTGSIAIDSSTFSNNTAVLNAGGISIASGTAAINHSTITANDVIISGPILTDGIQINAAATVSIGSTIIADNMSAGHADVVGTVNSVGFNLLSDTLAEFDQASDINGGVANLAPLSSVGANAPTHLPLSGSDAIDSGNARNGPDANGVSANVYADIGATEFVPSATAKKLFWSDADGWIYRANSDGSGTQQIFQTTNTPQDLEYDPVSNRIFWTEGDGDFGQIRSIDINGNDLQETPLSTVSNGLENPPSLLAPKGLAIDTANRLLYIAVDSNINNTSYSGADNRIDRYTINADGSVTFDAVAYALGRNSDPQMSRVIDLEYTDNLLGVEALIWSERGAGPSGGSPGVPTSFVVIDMTNDNVVISNSGAGTTPQAIAIDDTDGSAYFTNGVSLLDFDINFSTSSSTLVNSMAAADKVGLAYDTDNDRVWWTSTTGNIGSVSDLLTDDQIVITTAGNPNAIALANIPVADTPATLDTNTGITSLMQGDSAIIDNAVLSASDDAATDDQIIYTLLSDPANGELQLNGSTLSTTGANSFTQEQINLGQLSYQHNDSEVLSDEFLFAVADSVNTPVPASHNFSISIYGTNDFAPVANPDAIVVDQNASITVLADGTTTSLLANDTDADAGDTITATVFGAGPTNGSLTLQNDGTFI